MKRNSRLAQVFRLCSVVTVAALGITAATVSHAQSACDGCLNSHACQFKYDQCTKLSNCDALGPEASKQCYAACRKQYDSCQDTARTACKPYCEKK